MHLSLSGIRLLLHFICYSDHNHYSHLKINIHNEACNSFSGKRVRINLLSTLTYFTRTLKKDSIIYYCRYLAQQKFLFLLFLKFFLKILFLEKQCVIVGHTEIERSYVKQTFRQDTLCWTLESVELSVVVIWGDKPHDKKLSAGGSRCWHLTLFPSLQSQEFWEANEHGKYSGFNTLLRYNPSDKAGVLWLAVVESGPDAGSLLGVRAGGA